MSRRAILTGKPGMKFWICSRHSTASMERLGIANAASTVTVSGQSTYRKGEYYQNAFSTNNGSAAVYASVTNKATLSGATNLTNGYIFLVQTPENLFYDPDGNLHTDGRGTLNWDLENRLTNLVISAGPTLSQYSIDFLYDYLARRVRKIVSTNNGSSYVVQYTNKFVYDGWNLAAILDGSASVLYSFQWGTDLSGSLAGAGGIGGLLSMRVHSGSLAGTYFYFYDGNGNVAGLINGVDGTIAAQYEYGPFGELIRASGPLAKANPFRFSSKYQDDESGFFYYGNRFLNPSSGRWLNRDPIGEQGGLALYCVVDNEPIISIDFLGLEGDSPRGLPEEATSCCTKEKIANGETELQTRFKKASDEARRIGLTAVLPPGNGATCKNTSTDIIEWLFPFPSCWRCHLEERNYYSPTDDPKDNRLDHQVIICAAFAQGGSKFKEIIFDWWGDAYHRFRQPVSGGSPEAFRNQFRFPSRIYDFPYYLNCDGTVAYPLRPDFQPNFNGSTTPKKP